MGDSAGDKTEEPTPHKLREARKKGQVVKSKEVTTALIFLASYYILKSSVVKMWQGIEEYFKLSFSVLSSDISMALVLKLLSNLVMTMLLLLMPLMLTNVLVALIVESLQTGFNLSGESLKPQLNKINPLEGFKRLFSPKGLVELAKSIAKMAIIFNIMYSAVIKDLPTLLRTGGMPVLQAIIFSGDLAFKIATRVGMFYLFIALLDYFYQRYEYMKQMRMSKQEIKDEYKKLEGDPLIKQRLRDMAMQMAGGRGRGSAASADAVVTNPTHIAVAVKYDTDIMQAPQVVDKGKMLIAEQIKQIAYENNVMVLENKELAWELFNSTEIGGEIPPKLYSEVASILAMVYEIRKKRKKLV